MTSAFSWQNSISLCPASFCTPRPNLPFTPGISWLSAFAFQSPIMKRTSFSMLSISSVQFPADGWGWVPSLFLPGTKYGASNEDNGYLLQKIPWMHCYTQCPQPCSRPRPTHTSAGDSWTLTGNSGSAIHYSRVASGLFWPEIAMIILIWVITRTLLEDSSFYVPSSILVFEIQ